jgi:hypothetical protein
MQLQKHNARDDEYAKQLHCLALCYHHVQGLNVGKASEETGEHPDFSEDTEIHPKAKILTLGIMKLGLASVSTCSTIHESSTCTASHCMIMHMNITS